MQRFRVLHGEVVRVARYIFAVYIFLLAFLHYIDPAHFDALMLGLLLLPAAPFLREYFDSFDLLGLKVKFRKEAKRAAELIHRSSAVARISSGVTERSSFIHDASDYGVDALELDYVDRLAALGVRLERSIREAAKRNNLPSSETLRNVMSSLIAKGLVDHKFSFGVSDLIRLTGLVAVDRVPIDKKTAEEILSAGREALKVLDELPADHNRS